MWHSRCLVPLSFLFPVVKCFEIRKESSIAIAFVLFNDLLSNYYIIACFIYLFIYYSVIHIFQ
jgi:hypothetical protein